jgi:multiple antibiotic resistance protein
MLTTATTVAILLLVLGGLLTRLLHFSPGALGVASGIILLIIAVTMVLGQPDRNDDSHLAENKDPMQLAVFPLAVQLALNGLSDVGVIHLTSH